MARRAPCDDFRPSWPTIRQSAPRWPAKRHPPQVRQLHPAGHAFVNAEVSRHGQALDYNPCRECKLCVTSLPVGAISKTGDFDFGACFTHNSGNSTAASQTGCRPWRIARTRPISAPGSPIPKTRPSGRASRSNPGQGQTLYVTEGSPAKEYAERRFPHKPIKEVDRGSPKEG
jgi:ferredoxin